MLREVEGHPRTFKTKVCLVGEDGVPKTALIRRSVCGTFDEAYIRTLGTVVSKKTVLMDNPQGSPVKVDLMIHDIMGKRTFLQLFKENYFHGAKGIIAVFDATREDTLHNLPRWIDSVRDTVGPVPVVFVGTGIDSGDKMAVSEGDVRQVAESYEAPYIFASAKTGENVEAMFRLISGQIIRGWLAASPGRQGEVSQSRPHKPEDLSDIAEFDRVYREAFGADEEP